MGEETRRRDREREGKEGETGGRNIHPGSIEWYAELQAAYKAAGLASASAYWKARWITWP